MIIVCFLCCTSRAASAVGGHMIILVTVRCWSKLVPNLLLNLRQSLRNFYPNLTTFSKNTKLLIPTVGYPAQPGLTWRNRQVTQHNQD